MRTKNLSGLCFFQELLWIVIYVLTLVIMAATTECRITMKTIRRIENGERCDTLYLTNVIIRKE